MVANQIPSLADLPAEMVAAAQVDAERQAQWVAQFLGVLGENAIPRNRLTARFLLRLGAALRLRLWESEGFFFHREAGLPEADQAIRETIGSLHAPADDPSEFCVAVLRLAIQRFAWHGPRELGVDFSVGEAPEEALLDALADFLWTHRPR